MRSSAARSFSRLATTLNECMVTKTYRTNRLLLVSDPIQAISPSSWLLESIQFLACSDSVPSASMADLLLLPIGTGCRRSKSTFTSRRRMDRHGACGSDCAADYAHPKQCGSTRGGVERGSVCLCIVAVTERACKYETDESSRFAGSHSHRLIRRRTEGQPVLFDS